VTDCGGWRRIAALRRPPTAFDRLLTANFRNRGSRPRAGIQGRKQDFQLPAIDLGAHWRMLEPGSDSDWRIYRHREEAPPERGL